MQIETDIRLLTGEHNGHKFTFSSGFVEMFGHTWDKADIKTLVEIANLLHIDGFEMIEKRQPQKKQYSSLNGFFTDFYGNGSKED